MDNHNVACWSSINDIFHEIFWWPFGKYLMLHLLLLQVAELHHLPKSWRDAVVDSETGLFCKMPRHITLFWFSGLVLNINWKGPTKFSTTHVGIQGTFIDQLRHKKFNIHAKKILSNLGNPTRKGIVWYTDPNIRDNNIKAGHGCRQPACYKLRQIQDSLQISRKR